MKKILGYELMKLFDDNKIKLEDIKLPNSYIEEKRSFSKNWGSISYEGMGYCSPSIHSFETGAAPNSDNALGIYSGNEAYHGPCMYIFPDREYEIQN